MSTKPAAAHFRQIAREYGGGYDTDLIADAYRQQVGSDLERLAGPHLEKSFKAFCVSYAQRRGPI